MLTHIGILLYRVTKLSKKAATKKSGTNPITILSPSLPPRIKACMRVNVPGNKKLLPIIKPAALAIIMLQSSNVPCINITKINFVPKPLEIKKY